MGPTTATMLMSFFYVSRLMMGARAGKNRSHRRDVSSNGTESGSCWRKGKEGKSLSIEILCLSGRMLRTRTGMDRCDVLVEEGPRVRAMSFAHSFRVQGRCKGQCAWTAHREVAGGNGCVYWVAPQSINSPFRARLFPGPFLEIRELGIKTVNF